MQEESKLIPTSPQQSDHPDFPVFRAALLSIHELFMVPQLLRFDDVRSAMYFLSGYMSPPFIDVMKTQQPLSHEGVRVLVLAMIENRDNPEIMQYLRTRVQENKSNTEIFFNILKMHQGLQKACLSFSTPKEAETGLQWLSSCLSSVGDRRCEAVMILMSHNYRDSNILSYLLSQLTEAQVSQEAMKLINSLEQAAGRPLSARYARTPGTPEYLLHNLILAGVPIPRTHPLIQQLNPDLETASQGAISLLQALLPGMPSFISQIITRQLIPDDGSPLPPSFAELHPEVVQAFLEDSEVSERKHNARVDTPFAQTRVLARAVMEQYGDPAELQKIATRVIDQGLLPELCIQLPKLLAEDLFLHPDVFNKKMLMICDWISSFGVLQPSQFEQYVLANVREILSSRMRTMEPVEIVKIAHTMAHYSGFPMPDMLEMAVRKILGAAAPAIVDVDDDAPTTTALERLVRDHGPTFREHCLVFPDERHAETVMSHLLTHDVSVLFHESGEQQITALQAQLIMHAMVANHANPKVIAYLRQLVSAYPAAQFDAMLLNELQKYRQSVGDDADADANPTQLQKLAQLAHAVPSYLAPGEAAVPLMRQILDTVMEKGAKLKQPGPASVNEMAENFEQHPNLAQLCLSFANTQSAMGVMPHLLTAPRPVSILAHAMVVNHGKPKVMQYLNIVRQDLCSPQEFVDHLWSTLKLHKLDSPKFLEEMIIALPDDQREDISRLCMEHAQRDQRYDIVTMLLMLSPVLYQERSAELCTGRTLAGTSQQVAEKMQHGVLQQFALLDTLNAPARECPATAAKVLSDIFVILRQAANQEAPAASYVQQYILKCFNRTERSIFSNGITRKIEDTWHRHVLRSKDSNKVVQMIRVLFVIDQEMHRQGMDGGLQIQGKSFTEWLTHAVSERKRIGTDWSRKPCIDQVLAECLSQSDVHDNVQEAKFDDGGGVQAVVTTSASSRSPADAPRPSQGGSNTFYQPARPTGPPPVVPSDGVNVGLVSTSAPAPVE